MQIGHVDSGLVWPKKRLVAGAMSCFVQRIGEGWGVYAFYTQGFVISAAYIMMRHGKFPLSSAC